ncbi:hypothetical protein BpOF4_16000 [Alkalihalophilus pseudofirmus OF4]|uniref:YprB ribonuclease H-like domain-containing protein n=1 Tax=Alkalihalophilus pseudofirmus (strain ATCC BAA-2126 / JCM 17055 / OF4) TaxID=398511 RepID=D3G0T7_ALKPO|nr:ribonuclease H-like domain-containing protein [Alkalihalophilus pseudofirmus]ADC51249.1 hypothetical protein BpOF4_16000 [Alkalihalophilus pseudofirmus OF4]
MALKSKLGRLKKHMKIEPERPSSFEQADQDCNEHPSKTEDMHKEIPFLNKWTDQQTEPKWFEEHYTMVREVRYPIDTKHGHYLFAELSSIIDQWQSYDAAHPLSSHPLSAKGKRMDELLFFDTETTGLSSGAGNRIFLLGFGQVTDKEVIIKQYFLPGPEAEVSFYHHFLTDVSNMKNLVTYNGKAFDWPQVKTRHTFVRDQVPKLPKFGHYDLLHASRRLWKEILPSCKLSVVENEILGFIRVEDTPGYLAPMLYFDFLQEQDPDFVTGIIKHHEWDMLSLITLYIHLSKSLFKAEKKEESLHTIEKHEIARWFDYIGEKEKALELYEDIISSDRPAEKDILFKTMHQAAKLLKQNKDFESAKSYFYRLLEHQAYAIDSAIELSKILEHKDKNINKAFELAENGYEHFHATLHQRTTKENKRLEAELLKRIERLQKKLVI